MGISGEVRSMSQHHVPTGRSVLVVEDEVRLRDMLASAIGKMGFEVVTAASAEVAAKLMRQGSFDILVLDLNLPGEPGLEFLARVRRGEVGETHHGMQAIILTGFGDLPAARKAIHLDAVEFLTKPCALGELEQALGRAFGRRRGQVLNADGAFPAFSLKVESTKSPPSSAAPDGDPKAMEDIERNHILTTLEKHQGNRAATAAELGISLRKLYYRINDYQRKGLI